MTYFSYVFVQEFTRVNSTLAPSLGDHPIRRPPCFLSQRLKVLFNERVKVHLHCAKAKIFFDLRAAVLYEEHIKFCTNPSGIDVSFAFAF